MDRRPDYGRRQARMRARWALWRSSYAIDLGGRSSRLGCEDRNGDAFVIGAGAAASFRMTAWTGLGRATRAPHIAAQAGMQLWSDLPPWPDFCAGSQQGSGDVDAPG